MVEPAQPFDFGCASLHGQAAARFQPGERVVMRGVAGAGRLDAHAVDPVHDGRLGRAEGKVEGELFGLRLDAPAAIGLRRQLPVVDPGQPLAGLGRIAKAGLGEGSARNLAVVVETPAVDLRDGEVGELEVVHREARSPLPRRSGRPHALAEEGQLVAEGAAGLGVTDVAGEIPPLGLEVPVGAVIPRKLVLPARPGLPPLARLAGRESASSQKEPEKRQNLFHTHVFRP